MSNGECFNIGSHQESTVAEVVGIICELTGLPMTPTPLDTAAKFGARYQDIQRRVPDTSKVRTLLGWECSTSLRSGLQQTVDWARRNPWWLEQSVG
jgi:UDP-glucose 4-epimerase